MSEITPETTSNLLPAIPEVQTPVVKFNTGEREYNLHWLNTKLRMYDDPSEDAIDFWEADLHKLMSSPRNLWQELTDNRFPFSYYPDRLTERYWKEQGFSYPHTKYSENYDFLMYRDERGNDIAMYWHNTRLRIYGESEYNHVEMLYNTKDGPKFRGITNLEDWQWRYLFKQGFPIEYLPTVDMDLQTKQWLSRHKEYLDAEEILEDE